MNSPSYEQEHDGLPSSLNEDYTAPKQRIKDVRSARAIYRKILHDDQKNSLNRARVQAVADGKPPYDPEKLKRNGQAFRTNLNFGEMASQIEYAMAAYEDMIDSVHTLIRVKTNFGTDQERHRWENIIAEEFTCAFRNDSDVYFSQKNLANPHVVHGVGIAYFEDQYSYRFNSTGLDGFKMPVNTMATESEIEVGASKRHMPVHKLFEKIRNEEAAAKMGWDIDQVKKAIVAARSETSSNHNYNYERYQDEIRNNDLYASTKSAEVELIHMWVKEFDGTISHMIFTEDAKQEQNTSEDGFLYLRQGAYNNVHEAFTTFCYGTGNSFYAGIKGLGHKAYHHVMTLNRMMSNAMDSAAVSSSLMLKPKDAKALREANMIFAGPYALLPPNVEVQANVAPNLTNSVMPVLRESEKMLNKHLGGYNEQNAFNSSRERTKFEVAAEAQAASKLSSKAMTLFYQPWERLLREVFKRISNTSYPSYASGHDNAMEFQRRCFERGVPKEALDQIDHRKTRAVRAIGAGSKVERQRIFEDMKQEFHQLDSVGRRNLTRDIIGNQVGYEDLARYIPESDEPRETHDQKTAEIESKLMMATGEMIEISTIENHMDHMGIHLGEMNEVLEAVEANEMSLADAAQRILPLYEHTADHYEFIQGDAMNEQKLALIKQNLQQFGEIINNGLKEAQKLAEEQAQGSEQMTKQQLEIQKMQIKIQEVQLKMQVTAQKAEQELAIMQSKAAQEERIRDIKAARTVTDFL